VTAASPRVAMAPPVLTVRDVRLSRGTREILAGVSLDVVRGEVVALMGLSGAGKTTMLRVIAGLEPDESGAINLDHDGTPRDAASRTAAPRSSRVGMVFQFHYLFEHLTALENVCLAPVHVHGRTRREAESRAAVLLEQLGVAHRAGALPRELSGGEAQRVAIARALAMDPPLLLLDEPTAALDPARRSALGLALRQLAGDGRAILLTSHDVDFVRDHAHRVVILADGRAVEEGEPGQVLSHPSHPATRALLQQGAQDG
jgi:ABC-type polar amino acid transport system ATPase subunit